MNKSDVSEKTKHYELDDPKFGKVEVIEGEHSMAMTNGHFGGWTKAKDGSYFVARNRAERRKRKRL